MADIYKKRLMSILGSRYEIEKKYAEGGMGKIYLGMHRTLGKPVAIKVIDQRFGGDEKMRKRFFKEAKLVANLTHKGIIDIYDFGSREDFDFLIMPFIDGVTLSHKLKNEGRLSSSETLYIIQNVAEALAFAHKKHVVHRDIKPSNIMIDVQQQVILTDFGISKDLTDPEMTATGMILGSPRYMSPEQALGRPVDGRSDLYSLGLVFYEMITGKYPYDDKGTQALLYMQAHELPPRPDQIVSDLPEQVSAVIIKLLRKSPKHRYQTGEELIGDLLRCGSANYQIETAATADPVPLDLSNEITITENEPSPASNLSQSPPFQQASGGIIDSLKRFSSQFSYNRTTLLICALFIVGIAVLYALRPFIFDKKPSSDAKPVQSESAQVVTGMASYETMLDQILALGQNQEARFLDVWANQSAYQIGDKISYHFISDKSCYLVLLSKTSDGNLVQVFPNKYDQNQQVTANIKYSIPLEGSDLSLEVTGPIGREHLIAVTANKPFELFPLDFKNEPFFLFDKANPDKLAKTATHLAALKSMNFSQQKVSYIID